MADGAAMEKAAGNKSITNGFIADSFTENVEPNDESMDIIREFMDHIVPIHDVIDEPNSDFMANDTS